MGSDADLSTDDLAGRGGSRHGDPTGAEGGGFDQGPGATAAAAVPGTSRAPDAPAGPGGAGQGLGSAVLGEAVDPGSGGGPGTPGETGTGTPGQARAGTEGQDAGDAGDAGGQGVGRQVGGQVGGQGVGGQGAGAQDAGAQDAGDVGDAMGGIALLAPADGDRFRQRWSDAQARFVDDPQDAVQTADGLVAELMQSLARGFSEHKGRLEAQWQSGGNPDTEELRQALQMYRSFFNRLLST